VLDDDRRQELIARLEGLGENSSEDSSESMDASADNADEQVEGRNDADPANAEADSMDAADSDSDQGRQSGAQRRISELVRQRNTATEEFRELQERYAAMEAQLQEMQSASEQQQQQAPQIQQSYYDEYGNEINAPHSGEDFANLRAEFDQYRENQVIEQVKTQLESEISTALQAHPEVDGYWLRKQLIDAVRLNGSADIAETAEYYASFVKELQESAVSKYTQQASQSESPQAPPRLASRGTASGSASRQGDKPFTRDDARRNAYSILRGSQ